MSNQYGNMSAVSARDSSLVFCVDAAMVPSATTFTGTDAMQGLTLWTRIAALMEGGAQALSVLLILVYIVGFVILRWTLRVQMGLCTQGIVGLAEQCFSGTI